MNQRSLSDFLRRRLPEYEAASLHKHDHILDEKIDRWLQALQSDTDQALKNGLRSHRKPIQVQLGSVDPANNLDSTLRRSAPRDAACCLDNRPSDHHEYWLIFSRMMMQDLYFMFCAIRLGPSAFLTESGGGITGHIDVFAPDFVHSGPAEEPLLLTAIALEFIYLHEFAHAFRAHVPYLRQKEPVTRFGLCEVGDLELIPIPKPIVNQAIELDADLTALGIQLHQASTSKRPSSITGGDDVSYAEDLGYVLAIVFRLFELWRRDLQGKSYDASDASHPHPDVREVICDAWLAQRIKEDGMIKPELCKAVRRGRDRGEGDIDKLGPDFLPRMSYPHEQGKDLILLEIESVKEQLYEKVRPDLNTFVAD